MTTIHGAIMQGIVTLEMENADRPMGAIDPSSDAYRKGFVAPDDALVERREGTGIAGLADSDDEFVGQIRTFTKSPQGCSQTTLILEYKVGDRGKESKTLRNFPMAPSIEITKHPIGFHQHQIANKEHFALPIQHLQHLTELRFVILSKISHQNIGIDALHDLLRE